MTVHYKTREGGSVRTGLMDGPGEIYHADENGNGTIYKGNFVRGKLNDIDGEYITYSDDNFCIYRGTFVDNKMDGYITTFYYTTDIPESDDEKNITGNCHCRSRGRRYIYVHENDLDVELEKKIIIYSDGVPGASISSEIKLSKIVVEQHELNGRKIFTNFSISL